MKLVKIIKFWRWPKKIWVPILIIVIGILIFLLIPKQKPKPINLTEVKIGHVKQIVSSSGMLEGTDSADLRFKIPGKLNYIGVKQGQEVKKGVLIASLDTRDLENNLQQAYNTFEIKDSSAKRVEDDVKDHSSDENFTQKEERTAAQKTRDNAYDNVKAAKRALEDAFIYSPLSGIVTKADPNPGQIVSVTDVIAQIIDQSSYVFEAEIDESEIGQIKIGQTAEVTLNSYPNQIFKATVSKITPTTKTSDSGATIVIAKLDLGKPDINFLAGLNGQADIIINEIDNVTVIPIEALMEEDWVYRKIGDTYQKVKVEVGMRSDIDAEIKSGLNLRDQVATNPEDVKIKNNGFKFP